MVLIGSKITEVLLISRGCFVVDNLACMVTTSQQRPWVAEAMFAEEATPPDVLKL